jgi:hypothetical protein
MGIFVQPMVKAIGKEYLPIIRQEMNGQIEIK